MNDGKSQDKYADSDREADGGKEVERPPKDSLGVVGIGKCPRKYRKDISHKKGGERDEDVDHFVWNAIHPDVKLIPHRGEHDRVDLKVDQGQNRYQSDRDCVA